MLNLLWIHSIKKITIQQSETKDQALLIKEYKAKEIKGIKLKRLINIRKTYYNKFLINLLDFLNLNNKQALGKNKINFQRAKNFQTFQMYNLLSYKKKFKWNRDWFLNNLIKRLKEVLLHSNKILTKYSGKQQKCFLNRIKVFNKKIWTKLIKI